MTKSGDDFVQNIINQQIYSNYPSFPALQNLPQETSKKHHEEFSKTSNVFKKTS